MINRENVLLVEKHDVQIQEAVTTKENKTLLIRGINIYRVVKPLAEGYKELYKFKIDDDNRTLEVLKDYIGYYMVSVDRSAEDNSKFVWNCFKLGDGAEDNIVFLVEEPRQCTDEEVKILNEIFPEYFDNAF